MKICSILLINKGMQNKTIIRNYYTSTRLAEMRRIYNTNIGEKVEQLDLSHIAGGNMQWYKKLTSVLYIPTPCPTIPLMCLFKRYGNMHLQKMPCRRKFIAVLFTIVTT